MAANQRKLTKGQRLFFTQPPTSIRLMTDAIVEVSFDSHEPFFVATGLDVFVRPADVKPKSLTSTSP